MRTVTDRGWPGVASGDVRVKIRRIHPGFDASGGSFWEHVGIPDGYPTVREMRRSLITSV
ncbi:hypothetical protein FAGKG844_70073 [Frankia sp. AgKG'84/4]